MAILYARTAKEAVALLNNRRPRSRIRRLWLVSLEGTGQSPPVPAGATGKDGQMKHFLVWISVTALTVSLSTAPADVAVPDYRGDDNSTCQEWDFLTGGAPLGSYFAPDGTEGITYTPYPYGSPLEPYAQVAGTYAPSTGPGPGGAWSDYTADLFIFNSVDLSPDPYKLLRVQATFESKILPSYRRIIGSAIITWVITSGGVRMAATMNITRTAYLRCFFKNAGETIPSFDRKKTTRGISNITPNVRQQRTTSDTYLLRISVGTRSRPLTTTRK